MASKRPSSSKKNETVNFESLGQELGNKPPQAIDVEEAVLGAMLLESECVDLAMEELTPSCFYDPKHRMIFEAMSSLVTEHTSVDIITVSNKLKENGNLSEIGGVVVLANLSQLARLRISSTIPRFLSRKPSSEILFPPHTPY